MDNQWKPVGLSTSFKCAISLRSLPPSTLSNIFTPPPNVPPAMRYRLSLSKAMPRKCFSPVRSSLISFNEPSFPGSNMVRMSPSEAGSFRFVTYKYCVGYAAETGGLSTSAQRGGGSISVGFFGGSDKVLAASSATASSGKGGSLCDVSVFDSSKRVYNMSPKFR